MKAPALRGLERLVGAEGPWPPGRTPTVPRAPLEGTRGQKGRASRAGFQLCPLTPVCGLRLGRQRTLALPCADEEATNPAEEGTLVPKCAPPQGLPCSLARFVFTKRSPAGPGDPAPGQAPASVPGPRCCLSVVPRGPHVASEELGAVPPAGGRGKGTVSPGSMGLVGIRSGTSRPRLGFQATPRTRLRHQETRAMWGCGELLLLWLLVPAAGGAEHVYRPGRRVCALGAPRGPVSEPFAQRVYQPFLTTCDGPRVCSTYRTVYRTAYRRSPGPTPARPRYACCPGWKRTGGLPAACGAAICQPPCQNGGSCVQPGRCHCPAGWQGDTCQTDVDGHGTGGGGCPHRCADTPGSDWCRCAEGHGPSPRGKLSPPRRGTPGVAPGPNKGVDSVVEEEVRRLRSRVDVLEQKLQLVLAPLHSLASRALEQGLPDPGSLLAHSLRQLDRIDSLSEQISFLEEQLGSCSCKKEL